jgi:signal transduction histidine kinase
VGFIAAIGLLFGLEAADQRRDATRAAWSSAAVLLAARLALFAAVAALDDSGLSRVLFVLVPFAAYFAFGRAVSLALAAASLAVLLAGYALWVPHWYTDATKVSDILMFCVGLVLAISMASIAVGQQEGRARLETALHDLERSHAQLTAYSAQVAELSAAAERNKLARDIHDSLGHHLTAISIQLEKASAFRDRDAGAAQQALADARSSARHALDDVRLSVRTLRGEAARFSLPAKLTELVRQAGGQQPQITLSITGEESGISDAALTVLYRAAQEALTNARRHAQAGHVSVSVEFGRSGARIVVADDGRGFRPQPAGPPGSSGYGLTGMRERAALVGGTMEVESRPGGGTHVTVTVPALPAGVPGCPV